MKSPGVERADFRHFYNLHVRWGDMDALGHVSNVNVIRYLECGRVDYCQQALKLDFGSTQTAGWILADIRCAFRQQLRYPSNVEVATRCTAMGNRSGELACGIFRQGSDEPVASGTCVVVWFDFIQQQSARIPDSIRTAVREYEIVMPLEKP